MHSFQQMYKYILNRNIPDEYESSGIWSVRGSCHWYFYYILNDGEQNSHITKGQMILYILLFQVSVCKITIDLSFFYCIYQKLFLCSINNISHNEIERN